MAQVVATLGTESLFAELRMEVVWDRVALAMDMVEYSHRTGRFNRWEIGCDVAEEEYAADAAADLEAAAERALEDRGVHGWRDGGRDFARAVEVALAQVRDAAPVAAE